MDETYRVAVEGQGEHVSMEKLWDSGDWSVTGYWYV